MFGWRLKQLFHLNGRRLFSKEGTDRGKAWTWQPACVPEAGQMWALREVKEGHGKGQHGASVGPSGHGGD